MNLLIHILWYFVEHITIKYDDNRMLLLQLIYEKVWNKTEDHTELRELIWNKSFGIRLL